MEENYYYKDNKFIKSDVIPKGYVNITGEVLNDRLYITADSLLILIWNLNMKFPEHKYVLKYMADFIDNINDFIMSKNKGEIDD